MVNNVFAAYGYLKTNDFTLIGICDGQNAFTNFPKW